MAVSGVSSRSTSIYGTRNVITGLASGLDTESMIENAISAYKNKITALNQQRTKTEWKQEAYRSMVSKMSSFLSKYTSYRSANNLMSTSFFDQAVKTVAKGANKDLVSATGRASSDLRIDRVKQLASAATYKVSGTVLDGNTAEFGQNEVTAAAGGTLDLDKEMTIGKLNGSLTLAYGGKNATSYLSLSFDETQTFGSAEDLVNEINKQLSEQSVSIGTKTYTGSELLENVVKAEVGKDGQITFTDPKENNVYVSGASGNAQQLLLGGKEPSSDSEKQVKSLSVSSEALKTEKLSTYEYLMSRGGSMEITLDGVTKTVKLPTADEIIKNLNTDGLTDKEIASLKDALKDNPRALTKTDRQERRDEAFMKAFQDKVDAAFGEGKLTVSDANRTDSGDGKGIQFQFQASKGSTFSVNSSKGEVLGFGESGRVTSYLNTGKTLGEILGKDGFNGLEVAYAKDSNGNPTTTPALDANGQVLYSFKVNGKEIGQFNKDTSLSTVFNAMNSNSDSDVKVGYSKLTNELTFTAKDTGAASKIDFGGDNSLAAALFGKVDTGSDKYEKGQDAIFEATVNGTSLGEITRSSNSVEMDGMTINLKGTFGYEAAKDADGNEIKDADGNVKYNKIDTEAVTFETSSDADKIVDAVKQMVEDYNAMAKEIKDAYSTLPAQRSNGAYYEPLTAEDEDEMSESAIKNWNDKAKQGILFGDRDLASLYQRMTTAISMTGENGAALREAGITVSYSNGLSQLEFNEDKFRAALNNDPDKVRDAFTASTESGAKSNGLMQALKQPLDLYGKTEGGKGVLVEKAGSPLAPSTMYSNTIQKELNNIDSQIERWQEKMEDQIDHYTSQFSRLEQLIQQMNSQSSYFSQLMGG
nr:flagellar filament capping protein FliD [uncultured Oscillibacter sp.]